MNERTLGVFTTVKSPGVTTCEAKYYKSSI